MEIKRIFWSWTKLFFPFLAFSFISFLLILKHGPSLGMYLALLTWTLYILCIPSRHGQTIFGAIFSRLTSREVYTEPYFLSAALIFNIISIFISPELYTKTFATHVLFRMVTTIYPGWFVIAIAACGSLFPWLVGRERMQNMLFQLLYILLKIVGIATFLILAYPEFVIMLNLIGSA